MWLQRTTSQAVHAAETNNQKPLEGRCLHNGTASTQGTHTCRFKCANARYGSRSELSAPFQRSLEFMEPWNMNLTGSPVNIQFPTIRGCARRGVLWSDWFYWAEGNKDDLHVYILLNRRRSVGRVSGHPVSSRLIIYSSTRSSCFNTARACVFMGLCLALLSTVWPKTFSAMTMNAANTQTYEEIITIYLIWNIRFMLN